jgi:transcriptional regulator with XRE-family HTH domain
MVAPFANNIRAFRMEMHKTQPQMADLLDVPQSTYNNWENGKNEPSMKSLRKIAQQLGVSEDELIKSKPIIKVVHNQDNKDNSINGFEVHPLSKEYIESLEDTIAAQKQIIAAQEATINTQKAQIEALEAERLRRG